MNVAQLVVGETSIRVGDQSLTVREMRWPDAIQFFSKLSKMVGSMVEQSPEGRLTFDMAKLPDAIMESSEIGEFLIAKTTELTVEQIQQLPARCALDVLSAAIEINLNQEVLGKFKRIGAVITEGFAGPKPPVTA